MERNESVNLQLLVLDLQRNVLTEKGEGGGEGEGEGHH